MNKKSTRSAYRPMLPIGLEKLLTDYQNHCSKNGLREGSIAQYEKECRWFLKGLSDCGCKEGVDISASCVVTACLSLTSKSYLASTRTFLKYCAKSKVTDRDYSYVIPPYKRPQPMPSVYTEDEIFCMELAVDRSTNVGKRDYAIILLATRLGLRLEDIRTMTFNELDFNNEEIRLVQDKTFAQLSLPMVYELKNALLDYIHNGRPQSSNYVFQLVKPPHGLLSKSGIIACFWRALCKADIEIGNRGIGPRAFRSSLTSSMVNDGIPYEAVRRTLGHIDPNAISHYAKLDIERLRVYALPVPVASGKFVNFLSGGLQSEQL